MRGILLDLDNTLIDDRHATEQGFRTFYSAYGPRLDDAGADEAFVRWKLVIARHWDRFERGEISFQEQRRCRVRDFLGEALDDASADAAYRAYQQGYEAGWRLLPGVAAFLERTRDVPKVIITNGDRDAQSRKVRTADLDRHVVGIVTPNDCGHWKPSPEIFRVALTMLGLEPAECLMIGDDPVRDIEPAVRLGMRTFHVEPGRALLEALDGG